MKLKIILIVVALVMFFTVTVNAQTAWVEWEHQTNTSLGPPLQTTLDKWILLEAYPTYNQCMQAVYASARNCGPDHGSLHFECWDTGFSMRSSTDWHFLKFYCYPDTIDPRKGEIRDQDR